MTEMPSVADMRAYLDGTGWTRQPETWHGASIWRDRNSSVEVLVPDRDSSIDNPLRLREALDVVSGVEERPRNEIVRDVSDPDADTHTYWTFPDGDSLDLRTLNGRYRALGSIRKALRSTADSVLATRTESFRDDRTRGGNPTGQVRALLERVELWSDSDGCRFATRVPTAYIAGQHDDQGSLGASLLPHLSTTLGILRDTIAEETSDLSRVAAAGISAGLCEALGELTGQRRDRPLGVDFRWGRGRPAAWERVTFEFGAGSGAVLSDLATRLRRESSTAARATGQVDSLHGRRADGYWEVKLSGRLLEQGHEVRRRNGLRVLLADEQMYDATMRAHRGDRSIDVRGRLDRRGERMKLTVETGGFEVIE